MKKNIDKEILSRYVAGNASMEDQAYLDMIFAQEEYKEELEYILGADWEATFHLELEPHDLDHVLHSLYYKINNDQRPKKTGAMIKLWNTYMKVAAVILFPLALAFGIYSQLSNSPAKVDAQISYAELKAPLGSRVQFTLPDGSTGWLNSGSSLKYPLQFVDSRDVELTGEGYFDIAKNGKPFNVKASDINIAVLGTQFNVSAYDDDKNVDVVLESGKIKLNKIGGQKVIEMEPDDRVIYNTAQNTMQKTKVASDKYSSWKEGKLVFRNDPIEEVVKRLSRWYNVTIELEENRKSDLRLRATFVDEDIEEVLRLIKLTYPIEYEIQNREMDKDGNFENRKIKIRMI